MTLHQTQYSEDTGRFKRIISSVGLLVSCFLLCMVFLGLAYAGSYRLSLSISGTTERGSVQDTLISLLAGVHPDLIVRIAPVGREASAEDYVGVLSREWPEGMQIEVGHMAVGGDQFIPDVGLREQIGLYYYVDEDQDLQDSLWRITGAIPGMRLWQPTFRFRFRLSEAMTGQNICFRVLYKSELHGQLEAVSPQCIFVKEPSSEWDNWLLRADLVQNAVSMKNWPAVLNLADSLIGIGCTSRPILIDAQFAARQLGQYDKALYYLDLCFEKHGSILIETGPSTYDSLGARQLYEAVRMSLIEESNRPPRR